MNVAEIGTRFTGDLRPLRRAYREAAEMGSRYGQQVRAMSGHMEFFTAVVRRASLLIGAAGLGAALHSAAIEARGFGTAMAEVQTVAADASQIGELTESVRQLSLEFGSAPTGQAKALYEILSAGTSDAAAATDVLTAANRLAIGGVTDVKTAADGLTSTLNAYGAAAGGAAAVSDSFFVAAAAGKTTIAELSAEIGRVAPIAASMSIPLDEVTAAIAALTKGGIATGPAVRGLAQIMASVIKPTKEAADTAAKLGLDFNAAALQSKGLAGFLADVREKTKGNTTAMGLLFGGVEALVPALALSTTAAGSFAEALEAMESKTGATSRAYEIMAGTMENRINRLRVRVTGQIVAIGGALLNVAVPAAEAFADNFVPIMEVAAQAAAVLAAVMVTKLAVALALSARNTIVSVTASIAQARANAVNTGLIAKQAQAQFVAATAALNAARASGTNTAALEAQRAALIRVSTAHAQARLATDAHTAAMARASLAGRVAAGSMAALRGALAFFGGPIGLAITIALAAIGTGFLNAGRKARQAAADARKAAEDFAAALGVMDDANVTATFVDRVELADRWEQAIREQAEKVAELNRLRLAGEAMTRFEQIPASQQRRGGPGTRSVPTEFGRQWTEANTKLEQYRSSLAQVRREQEAAGSESFRRMQAAASANIQIPEIPDLNVDLGGEDSTKETRRFAETIRERVGLLTEVAEAQRAMGVDTASVMGELSRLYVTAAERVRGFGDAARLSPELLEDYRTWLGLVQQLAAAGMQGIGPEAPKPVAQLRPPTITVPNLSLVAEQARNDNFRDLMGFMAESGRRTAKALEEGAKRAAEALSEASLNVRNMWSGLLSGLPQQLNDLRGMFGALQDKRAAQVQAGGAATGLAPFPGAVAFMLAAEALAPVLEALREPFAALMVPIQMVAAAFGPLLTSVVKALFPIMKAFGIAVTYVAQVAGYVSGALLKVVGEIIRTVGSLIAKIPGLGQEGAAIKKFGKGLTDASREMFAMAESMPAVRDELRNLDWDEAMARASESADRLADSLTNVPAIFDLIARRAQVMRGTGAVTMPPPSTSVNLAPAPAPSPASQSQGPPTYVSAPVSLTIAPGAFVINGGDPRVVETQLRRFKDELINDLNMPGTSPLSRAVVERVRKASA